nr:hypothetical protein F21F8.8 - Caenorhabditis elegans [Caenorhabditis elegans]
MILTIKKADNVMGNYRYAMLVFTLGSMIYSLVEILGQPVAHMKGSMFVVFTHNTFMNISYSFGELLASLHCVLTGVVASLLSCQFIYRYIALCKSYLLVHLKGVNLLLILTPVLFSLFEELMTCFHMNSTTTSFIGPMYWSGGDDGEIHLKPKEIAASFSCSTVLVASFLIILFCALSIFSKLKSTIHDFSPKALDVNRQIFKMLCMQTIIPMITMYTPVALFVLLPMIGKDIPYLGNLTSSSLAVYPLKAIIGEDLCYEKLY